MGSYKQNVRGGWLGPWAFAITAAGVVGWAAQALLPATVTLSSGPLAIIVVVVLGLYIGTVLHFHYAQPATDSLIRPRVLLFKKEQIGLFVISPADWLMYRAAYTLFVTESDGFERVLGIGEVLIFQDDKNVQLLIRERAAGADEIWKSLDAGSKDHFGQIVLKPGAPKIEWIAHEAS
ncbi:hypothetical protein NKJ23_25570 [Mesorhizobium sp. M0184]|uniref:hypothetical protein n=1 Tax=Mesorhizobium sp. M0184 TaxID=2956906 RepID=UPI00333C9831